jgi:hypothetical protein
MNTPNCIIKIPIINPIIQNITSNISTYLLSIDVYYKFIQYNLIDKLNYLMFN